MLVVLGVGPGEDADERRGAAVVAGKVEGRPDEGVEDVLELGAFLPGDFGQCGQAAVFNSSRRRRNTSSMSLSFEPKW